MAFFKFRFPGQSASASVDAVASGPSENIEVVRKRARHRLIGSVVLVLVAVVGFPLLFDTQPRPVAVDTPIVIPDRQTASPLTSPVPATQAPAKPLPLVAEPVSTHASLDDKEEIVPPAAQASGPTRVAITQPNGSALVPQPKAEIAPSMKMAKSDEAGHKADAPAPKPQSKSADKKPEPAHAKAEVKPAAKPKDDGHKARALLDGKAAPAERTVIQAGAFADADKVREVRRKLEQAGLTTYTQVIDGKDGKRTTRVRLGPYDSKEEAEKAAARIRKLGLSPTLQKI